MGLLQINNIIYFLILLGIILSSYYFIYTIFNIYMSYKYITNYNEYYGILVFFMEKSYNVIYKDHIMIYSIEGIKIDDKELKKLTESFIKLTFDLMGNKLVSIFINMFGTKDNLIYNMVDFFNEKYTNDKILENTTNNFLNR